MLVRYLVEDDEAQTRTARHVISQGCYLTSTVLLETAWVLQSRLRWPRDIIATALSGFVDTPSVTVGDDRVGWALERYAGGADLGDMLHLAQATSASKFATFDRKIARQAGSDCPLPIETLS